jgi:periodic tryptophan protein 1
MWVHHDIMLNAYPLCMDWVSHCDGRKGNFAAVGQMDGNIDLWDLNVTDAMRPALTLGDGDFEDEEFIPEVVEEDENPRAGKKMKIQGGGWKSTTSGSTKKKKKRFTKAFEAPKTAHSSAVMTLNTNPIKSTILASGSADKTVKLWDLSNGRCVQTFNHHSNKVQCVKWHRTEETILLTAAYDKSVCLLDVRTNLPAARMNLSADAENAIWSEENELYDRKKIEIIYRFVTSLRLVV